MNSLEQKSGPGLKIETIKNPEGGEVSFCPERGGIITSLKLSGKQVLYMDEETFRNMEVSVKGGIPLLFPNAGPIPDEIKTPEFAELKQHGFARDSKFITNIKNNGFTQTLESSNETKKVYPYDFRLTIEGYFEENGSFNIVQTVENLEKDKDLPVSSGLHPYFNVPLAEKASIEFDFEGGEVIKENFEKWANGKAVSIPNPGTEMRIVIPTIGTLVLEASSSYERIWVWSLPEKDFICVEPVMRDKGGIITKPEIVQPNKTSIAKLNINIIDSQ